MSNVNPDRLQWIALALGTVALLSLVPQSPTLAPLSLIPGLAAIAVGSVAAVRSGRAHASTRAPARVGIWAGVVATAVGWIALIATT